MKKTALPALLALSLIAGALALPGSYAQSLTNKRVASKPVAAPGKTPSPLKLSGLKKIFQNRKDGNVTAGDPCSTAVPLTFGQPTDGALSSGDCLLGDGTLIDFYSFHGTTGQPIFISMTSGAFDTFLYLLDDQGNIIDQNDDVQLGDTDSRIPSVGGVITLPFTGDFIIGANSFDAGVIGAYQLTLSTDAPCTIAPLAFNQTVNGNLTSASCAVNIGNEPFYTDFYSFNGTAGQQVSISMNSAAFDAYLVFHFPTTGGIEDDDSGGGTNPRIPASGLFTLPETGLYTIEAGSANSFEMGSYSLTLTAPATTTIKARADFDGDGRSDVSVQRPGDGSWFAIRSSDGATFTNTWGNAGDVTTPGDFDGDGKTDLAVYRASSGQWFVLRSSDSSVTIANWGNPGDVPEAGDFDGDGKTDITVYRPSTGVWYALRTSDGGVSISGWGNAGDVPVPADYDGDGKTDVAVYRPSTGVWYMLNSTTSVQIVGWGQPGDKPVEADYDGDGKDDIAVYRPADNNWYVLNSSTGIPTIVNWGNSTDQPVPADYDGDGKADIAVFRQGNWYILRSTGGVTISVLGTTGDVAIPARYIP